jgi:glycosyltransferase involved in cell wall biosynthesis
MLIAGRLTADRGRADWHRVLPVLAARRGDTLAVVVAGDGAMRQEVERLLAAQPCGFLAGPVRRAEMGGLLAKSNLYATLSPFENGSLAVYEAVVSGLPVAALDAGGRLLRTAERGGFISAPTAQLAAIARLQGLASGVFARVQMRLLRRNKP